MKKESILVLQEYLVDACSLGALEHVKYFLKEGADINSWNLQEFTPLMAAALRGQEKTVRLLLKKGADVHQKHRIGFTAMSCALASKNAGVINLLKEHGGKFP